LLKANLYDKIIVGLHKSDKSPFNDYKFTSEEISLINKIKNQTDLTLVIFSKPYSMLDIDITGIESILIAYQNSDVFQIKAAQAVFGGIEIKGVLPVTINKKIPVNTSIILKKKKILSFEHHLNKGFETFRLKKIDSLINFAIQNEMIPGAQILIAKQGSIIYNKSYGFHTYDKNIEVANTDIYDLASLTKILVSVPLIIKEFENNDMSFDTSLKDLFPELELFDKADLKIDEILSHYAGLTPWIPFYKETLDSISKKQLKKHYSNIKTENFKVEVKDGLFMRSWNDTIFKRIINSDLLKKKEYKYSDLPYYLIKKYLEDKYSQTLDVMIDNYIFSKIGANSLYYNPHKNVNPKTIVPSEIDTYFRNGVLKGFVHDMGASMQGGIGGHAGLFGNAVDVAKLMQLFLQKGTYGNDIFFSSNIFDEFNKCHFCEDNVRRGIGFDKPEIDDSDTITCDCVSENSFGHSGFTGTYAWADPESQLVYVFLSNRTYPTMENRKLIVNNIRTDIKKIIFN
jgi:CubicO group peptidase (beta-lactamase class C family)